MNDVNSGTTDLSALLNSAHALVERRRYAQARAAVSQGLKHFPENTELLYLSAFIDYVEDNNTAAMQGVQQVLAADPEHYGARRLCARLHEEANEFSQAEALWIGLLREYPEDSDCYAAYAELMLKTLNFDKAKRLAEEGLRTSPDHGECLYVSALIDVIQGSALSPAKTEHLQRLLVEYPEHARTSLALVVALHDQGKNKDALRLAQELLRSQPDSQQFVDLARELKAQTHWSMLPLYPMQRWGWGGAIALTVVGFVGVRAIGQQAPGTIADVVTFAWFGYVIYSWVWPSLIRKMV